MKSKKKISKENLKFCFTSIINHLEKKKLPKYPKSLDKSYPIFVTWKKGKNRSLRGCIGTFTSQPLSKNLQKYALISAFQDSRFLPIKINEISKLHLSLSFLFDYQKNKKWNEWEIGIHGIIIEFERDDDMLEATFLPEVAKEQGWGRLETIRFLVRKAGFDGDLEEVLEGISLTSYRSMKGFMSYDEYLVCLEEDKE